jgi:hypothetical protein
MSGGGMFGLGKSNSSNQSTSQSTGMSESVSGTQSAQASNQSIAFSDLYNQLFSGATTAAETGVANGAQLGDAARQLFTGGTNFLSDLETGNTGTDYLTGRLSSNNPALETQISNLGADAGRFLQQQVLPQIAQSSIESGTLGNDRQGVAQGMAIDATTRDFLTQAGNLRATDVAQRDAAATSIAQNSLQAAATGLGALPSLMDLLTSSAAPELGIYSNLSKILGGPTTLTSSQAISNSFSKAYGQQSSNGQSSGSSNAWDFRLAGGGGAGGGGGGYGF